MTLLDRVFAPSGFAGPPAPWDDVWYEPFASMSASGVAINEEAALRVSAVFRAVSLISSTLGRLPLVLFEEFPGNRKERAFNDSLYEVLHDRPNDWQSAFEFKEFMQGCLLLRGNGYAEIESGRRGFVDQLIPFHPCAVEVERLPNRRLRYQVFEPGGKKRAITQDRMFHVRGFSTDGIKGLSTIGLMRDSVGLSIATESHGARVFSQRANHAGVLEMAGTLTDPTYDRLKKQLESRTTGLANSHRTLILEEGLTWKTVGMSNDDAQFILTRTFQLKEIARWFGVPPHKIFDLDKSSFNNIEEQGIDFVQDGVSPNAARWEGAIKRSLILKPNQQAKFIVDALLRGRTVERYQAHRFAIQDGWRSRNEVRVIEDENPVPGLDGYLEPANMRGAGRGPDDPGPTPPDDPEEPDDVEGDDEEEKRMERKRRERKRERALAAIQDGGSVRAKKILRDASARMVRRELDRLRKAAERFAAKAGEDVEAWNAAVTSLYEEHAIALSEVLHLSLPTAERYCRAQMEKILGGGLAAAADWQETKPEELAQLALSEE